MAERSNPTAKNSQDAAPDVSTLQKRGRRRLVGAIALVLLAVIVLPMVFDPEPKPGSGAPLVNIRIPSEEGSAFTPKALPKPAPEAAPAPPAPAVAAAPAAPAVATPPVVVPAEAPKTAGKPSGQAAEQKAEQKAEKKAEKPSAKAEPAKPAAGEKPASSGAEQWLYQVGAFASADKVKEISDQLKAAGLPHYTESVATAKGKVTRVRLGPFTSRQAAEHALERAKALGLNPVNVAPK